MRRIPKITKAATLLLLTSLMTLALAQDTGQRVVKRGVIQEDTYVAGQSVSVDADVVGDVVAAGGDVSIGGKISADVIAAGGQVAIRASVGDDVRAAGGQVTINAMIGDDLIAAGGSVTVDAGTRVGGRTWLSGGALDIAGQLGRELKAAGGSVSVSAQVDGNVELAGESIQILPGATIKGDLVYRSNNEIRIDKKATISGSVVRKPLPKRDKWGRGGGTVMSLLALFVASLILAYLFPTFLAGAATTVRSHAGKSLLTGFVLLIMVPVTVVVLMALVVGWLAGLILLALYLAAIPLAILVGVRSLAEIGARWFKQDPGDSWLRLSLALAITLVALGLLGWLPVIGGLIWFLLLIAGLGAGASVGYQRYQAK